MAYTDELIKSFFHGLDERGVKLTGGQRRELHFPRFLRDLKILIMDEATASLDNQ